MSAAATEVTGRDRAMYFRRPLLKKELPLRYIRWVRFVWFTGRSEMEMERN